VIKNGELFVSQKDIWSNIKHRNTSPYVKRVIMWNCSKQQIRPQLDPNDTVNTTVGIYQQVDYLIAISLNEIIIYAIYVITYLIFVSPPNVLTAYLYDLNISNINFTTFFGSDHL
jgi:hypothetical protein